MKRTSKLLALILAVLMMVMPMPTGIFAADTSVKNNSMNTTDKEIIENAEVRREAILNSPTTVTVKGTKYYVSNKGNDNNDGKSPDKAWTTIDKVNSADLKPGDGVFFERGGVWRNIQIKARDGVTYSAYGEGEKPSFYGWLEDGANPDYWKLVSGSKNVWVYHKDINECGTIVFNGGEKTANKYAVYWDVNTKRYVVSLDMKTPFSVNLLENNQFFNEVDLTEATGLLFADDDYRKEGTSFIESGAALLLYGVDNKGKLYLRCDEGNPGTVYNSIEFTTDAHGGKTGNQGGDFIKLAEDNVIDNLCFKYGAGLAMHLNHGAVIQNCEIAYIGGGAYAYTPIENHPDRTDPNFDLSWMILLDGNAIIGVSDIHPTNVKMQNNYIHQVFDKAFNLEYSMGNTLENITISGNLFERNGAGTNIYNFFPNDQENAVRFKNVITDDNYFMYTGYGWNRRNANGDSDNWNNNILNCEFYRPTQFENVVYSNNVFFLPAYGFFHLSGGASLEPFTFKGNTYAHTDDGVILRDDTTNGGYKRYHYDENAEQTIKELTGDKTAIVLPPSFAPTDSENDALVSTAQAQTAPPTATPKPAATTKPTTKPVTGKPVDKPFNNEAQRFFDNLPDEAKEGITWTRKSMDGIEYIEAFKDDGKQRPLIFVLHGGGGKKEDSVYELDMYAHEGFYAVALDVAAHGESDRGAMLNMDAWLETVGYIDTLIDFYKDNKNADNTRFAVSGGSMGGAITFLYGVKGAHTPSLLMPEIGAADYTQIFNGRANAIMDKGEQTGWEARTPELTAKAEELSAVNNVDKFVNIPMWANFGELDKDGGVEGAVEFIRLLKEAGGTIQHLEIIKGGGHGDFPDEVNNGKMEYIKKHMKIQE